MTAYKIGEYIKYSTAGVCLIEDIKKIDYLHNHNPQEFYVLKPVSGNSSTVYIPLANEALTSKMRKLLSKAEIDFLIDSSKNCEIAWICDRKQRNEQFKTMLSRSDPLELLQLISCIYLRKQELLKQGKHISSTDDSILSSAESLVENEFSFVLNLSGAGLGAYIRDRLGIA